MENTLSGITLIALVITIIVLLILSGIAISMISGNNGILNKTVNAKIKTEEAAEKEKIKLALMAARNENGISAERLKEACDAEFGENKTQSIVFDDGEMEILVKDTGREYYIDKNGDITVTDTEKMTDTEKGLSGSGTSTNPYQISSIEDLIYLGEQVTAGTTYNGQVIELTRDLNFKSLNSYIDATVIVNEETKIDLMTSMIKGEGFEPIGDNSHKFKGKLNGKGYSIINLYENRTDKGGGLISVCDERSEVRNLSLKKANITSTSSSGGITAHCAKGNIISCSFEGNISATVCGGIVGKATGYGGLGLISDCCVYGNITGSVYAAGIAGEFWSDPIIKNCINYASIKNTKYGYYNCTGGLAGYVPEASGKIINSCNMGEINDLYNPVGGLFGRGSDTRATTAFINSYNVGDISVNSNKAGGIMGTGQNNQYRNCFYKNTDLSVGIGAGETSLNVQGKSEEYMKSQNFVNDLNKLIEDGKTINQDLTDDPETEEDEREVTINTNGYAKWVYNAGDYPTLDLTTKWNGTTWVKE